MPPSPPAAPCQPATISLAGEWKFALDREDQGVAEAWFARKLDGAIQLPGSLAAQGVGDAVNVDTKWTGTIFDKSYYTLPEYEPYRKSGHVRIPFFLQPETHYVGAAWYQCEISVPASWAGKRMILTLERPHWQTRVWLDEREIGQSDSLSVAHQYELGASTSAIVRCLTIRVDNRLLIEIGENAHSITDHTQGNWNGIVGRIELSIKNDAWIENLQVYPKLASQSATARGKIGFVQNYPLPDSMSVEFTVTLTNVAVPFPVLIRQTANVSPDGSFETEIFFGEDAQTWNEFNPAIYRLIARLANYDCQTVNFGLREISALGNQLHINGRKLFLRGALDCCVYPLTGYPPMDLESWRCILRTVQAYGLNHLRFHSWCPPEAAFVAGDELGVYFQVECAAWPNSVAVLAFNSPAGIGDGKAVDVWVYAEAERILRAYGNHPCFVLFSHGNEPGGPHHKAYLSEWVKHFQARDSRRLYTGAAGWPELPENDFHVISDPRIHQWGDGLNCRINGQPPATIADYAHIVSKRDMPVIGHEIGQWCSYPALDDEPKYLGHLKPHNFEIFRDTLIAHGLDKQIGIFVLASGKLQTLCYKEEIESALRTPAMGGFQLLGLQDFPGQGTAPVGVLNAFWESKGYVAAAEYRRFCNASVPLARLAKRVFTSDETLEAGIEVAHFGPAPFEEAIVAWRLTDEAGRIFAAGLLPPQNIPIGNSVKLGHITVWLQGAKVPGKYRLIINVEGTAFENDWNVWLYPNRAEITSGAAFLTQTLDATAQARLAAGGSVLLLLPPTRLRGDVALGFSPIFWNTSCTQRQAPHTLGILCDPQHSALTHFPTDCHSDWHWYYLLTQAGAMVLDDLPFALPPVVQVIDDWFTNRRLGLIFEARCNGGKLLVCSIDLQRQMESNPVARQLLHSLLRYMNSEHFAPSVEISPAKINGLIKF